MFRRIQHVAESSKQNLNIWSKSYSTYITLTVCPQPGNLRFWVILPGGLLAINHKARGVYVQLPHTFGPLNSSDDALSPGSTTSACAPVYFKGTIATTTVPSAILFPHRSVPTLLQLLHG
jgi:hypothetical protein